MVQRNKNTFKRSILIRWVYSYLVVFIVPLVLFLIFTITSISILNKDAVESNSLVVQFMRHEFDSVFSHINAMSDRVLTHSQFQRLANASTSAELDVMYRYDTTIELGQMSDSRNSILDCMLYSPTMNVYFTSERWGKMDDLVLMDEFSLGWPQEEFDRVFFGNNHTLQLEDASCSLAGGCTLDRLLIVRPVSYIRSGWRHNFYLAFLVDVSSIFTGTLQQFQDLVILNGITGTVLYDFTNSYEDGEYVEYLAKLPSGHSASEKGKIITSGSSNVTNIKYVVVRDQIIFYRSLLRLIIISLCCFAVALIGGFFVVRWRLRREWEIYAHAMEATGTLVDTSQPLGSPYSPFISSFSQMKQEKDGMSQVIRTQTESLKSHAIANLLDSSGGPVSNEVLADYGIYLVSDQFFVLLLVPQEGANLSQVEQRSLLYFQDLSYVVLPFSSPHGVALILNSPFLETEDSSYDKLSQQVHALLNDATFSLREASSSDRVTGLHSLGKAYMEAVNVLEYCRGLLSDVEFMFYRDVVEVCNQVHFTYTTDQELRLVQAIQQGNALLAKEIIEEVVAENTEQAVLPQRMRYLLFSIASTIIRTANRFDERYRDVIPTISLPPILQADDYRRSQRELEQILFTLCEAVLSIEQQYEHTTALTYKVYRSALQQIEELYADSMLNVSQIATNLDVSIVYLSRSFKQYHKGNISDYISQTRVLAAKKLLSEGVLVSDVVDLCGFGSLRTFMRVFKKEEGITPGQYRAIQMQENI